MLSSHLLRITIPIYIAATLALTTVGCGEADTSSESNNLQANNIVNTNNSPDNSSTQQPPTNNQANNTTANSNASCAHGEMRPLSQQCCPELGDSACDTELFCAAFDGRSQPICYSNGSRADNYQCSHNDHCQSGNCQDDVCKPATSDDPAQPNNDNCQDDECPPSTAIQVESGAFHSCTLFDSGRVKCWGDNTNGQLGIGDLETTEKLEPTPVINLNNATYLSAGNSHTCAVLTDNSVKCWGNNSHGQLGIGNTSSQSAPTAIPNLINVDTITAGNTHTCARMTNGSVKCWGSNSSGELGTGSTSDNQATPTNVYDLTNVQQIDIGGADSGISCALMPDKTARCWGSNDTGQLGMGSMIMLHSATPIGVQGLSTINQLSVGGEHACALLITGEVYCWGNNDFRQLGTDDSNGSFYPVESQAPSGIASIDAGATDSCAVMANGTVRCWGSQFGDVVFPGLPFEESFVEIENLTDITQVSVGGFHACALNTDAEVYCWGHNNKGQLATGTTSALSAAVKVNF